jgi:hypothetical protein
MGVTPFLRQPNKGRSMNRVLYARSAAHGSAFGRTTQTFPELLSDPLTRALMAADGVDAVALEAELREIADKLPAQETTTESLCGGFC